jgi:hypothetical protein
MAAAVAEPASAFVQRDLNEPSAEARSSTEGIQFGVSLDIGSLHRVFNLRLVSQQRAQRAIDPSVISAHEDLEERSVALKNPFDDLLIARNLTFDNW